MLLKRCALGCAALVVALGFFVGSCDVGEVIPPPPAPPAMSVPGPYPYIEYDSNPAPRGWEDRQGQWELVWRDEFTGTELDRTRWNIDTGTGAQFGLTGWGNYEYQYYRESNVRVQNGMLVLESDNTPHGEGGQHRNFTSGKVTSGGTRSSSGYGDNVYPERFSISEGFIEARIRAPRGQGFWPAFWTLGTTSNRYGNGGADAHTGWPASGELDIMEMRGTREWEHTAAFHFGRSFPVHQFRYSSLDVRNEALVGADRDMASDFHVYGVRWDANSINFYFNGRMWFSFDLRQIGAADRASFTAATGQFININLALGGRFLPVPIRHPDPELFVANAPFENRSLMVDWVRVYRRVGGNAVVHVRGERMPDDWVPAF